MRFSDMMGSGEERSRKPSETDNAVSDALAPYLDAVVPPAPPSPTGQPIENSEAPEASATVVMLDSPPPVDAAPPLPPPAPASKAHTVESVFPIVPVEPLPGIGGAESAPLAPREPSATELADLADFTPLSDDLLPRRRARA
jgi:hypothetical protein